MIVLCGTIIRSHITSAIYKASSNNQLNKQINLINKFSVSAMLDTRIVRPGSNLGRVIGILPENFRGFLPNPYLLTIQDNLITFENTALPMK
jgi:hypothetical protein